MTVWVALLIVLLVVIYLPAFGMLLVYSINLLFLCCLALWQRRRVLRIVESGERPSVTVQVPLYNERYVSQRIIDAVARLDWPRDKLHIQILDDSTDETRQIVAEAVQRWRDEGVNIEQIHRPDRVGYKAGALAYGLERTQGEFIAIFDADFVPEPDFLRQTIPALMAEPRAGFIQVRWEHLNWEASWLTRIQAIAIDAHFAIEQYARYYGGYAFNFNGTAGVWRRTAIDDAGGWRHLTLTEDLDLSYRAWLRGWRGLYRRDLTSPAELPPTMTAFRRQQARWAQGSIECARLLLPSIWRSPYSLLAKIQASVHLLGPMVSPIMALVMLCYPPLLVVLSLLPNTGDIFPMISAIGPLTLAPTVFFLAAQVIVRRPDWRTLVAVILFQFIGAGMSMNTLRAIIKAWLGQRGEFLRTPKWGSVSLQSSNYRLKADLGVIIDLLWGLIGLLIAVLAARYNHLFMVVYGLMTCLGSWWVAIWTLWPDLRGMVTSKRPSLAINSGSKA